MPTYGAMFQISDQGRIQEDSSHLRETAIDAAHQASEIKGFAKIVSGVAEKTHKRHVILNQIRGTWDRSIQELD